MSAPGFSSEQRRYLEGFTAGADVVRRLSGFPSFRDLITGTGIAARDGSGNVPHPDAAAIAAQDEALARGAKLAAEEMAKRARPPLDLRGEIDAHARAGRPPRGADVFLWKFHGLFWVAPAEDSFMCRLRFPGGIVTAAQIEGLADLAERHAAGHVDITTRANLQMRGIAPARAAEVLRGLDEMGIVTRGAGADNVRNITAPPTAGIDPLELVDTGPLARALHWHIAERRELYGLPRKFNIAFDGGGTTGSLEETNDIAFAARRLREGGEVGFRLGLGGITGHRDFASDTGVFLRPEECIDVADAVIRVFIRHGDRTDRKKARLKYVLERFGAGGYLERVEDLLGRSLRRVPLETCESRAPLDREAHVGVRRQRQEGRSWLGFVPPAARVSSDALRVLARLASEVGDRVLRLTVWQNALLAGLDENGLRRAEEALEELGFATRPNSLRAGLVACTGNKGCKYAATDTKGHALEIARELEGRVTLDRPINIHLTGCPHSCAQHFIGDIGLLGTKVERGDELVEGYRVYVGGGFGEKCRIAREVDEGVAAEALVDRLEGILRAYLERRRHGEDFSAFCARLDDERLCEIFARRVAGGQRISITCAHETR